MCNKEEPHTNIKDLPKQLAKINYVIMLTICYYTLYVMLLYVIGSEKRDHFALKMIFQYSAI